MRSTKKLLAGALAFSVITSGISSFAAGASDVEGTRYANSIQLLSALGIMNGDGDGSYRPNDTITRAEVTRMVIHALGLEDAATAAKGISKFPDVPVEHWANGYINIATSQNIIVGDDTGNFRPNDKITYAEAMTIMVRALGYEVAAERKGGFPQGYLVVGSDNKLNTGVTVSAKEAISRGEVALMTENALEANLMEITGYGDDLKYEVTDKNLLKDKLKVTKGEGQVVAIDTTSLDDGGKLASGQIKIGDTVYDTSSSFNNLLGYNVEYYLKDTKTSDDTVILALSKDEKNSTVKIDAKLFEAVTTKNGARAVEYYKQDTDSKTSTATLEDGAKLIYNGKLETMTDELIDMKNKSGNVTLLDTDRNGKYDIVFVTEYKNIVVEEVTASGKIVDKYGNETIKLDSDDDDLRYMITKGYEEIELSDLKEYDVLSTAASKDGKLYSIAVTNSTVEGKITGIYDDGVYVGDKFYEIAANYTDELARGTEGVFYLDIDGRIAAADTTVSVGRNYAYLVKAFADMNMDETAKFKLFTTDGKELVYEASEKIRFNGIGGKLATDVVEALNESGSTEKQLVTYSLNADKKLISLNTAEDNTDSGNVNENKFTMNDNLSNVKYNEKLKTLGNIKIDDKTVIFDIPSDASDASDYSIANISKFVDEQSYDVIVFDKTDDFYAKAVIVTNASLNANANSSIAVVSKVVSVSNSNDDLAEKLYAFQDGKEISIEAENETVLRKSGKKLENGDIIQYQTNSNGEISGIRVLFDKDGKSTEKEETPAENLTTIYGKVTKKFSSSINVTVNGGAVKNLQISDDTVVYSVDTTKTKNNIKVITAGDIQAYDEDEENRVFVRLYKGIVQEIAVIK